MGEPITLYSARGKPVTVYGRQQSLIFEALGYTKTPPEIAVEPEPEQSKPKAKAAKRNTRAS